MIVELAPEEFSNVLPLYHRTDLRFPLISAVLERRQRGQVFVDPQNRSALIVNNFGFMLYVGQEVNPEFGASLGELFETGSGLTRSYFLWYSPPTQWQQKLSALGARVRERVRFQFRGDSIEPIVCPAGFEMRTLDAELVPKTKKFGLDIDSRFWSSAKDLETNGLGCCILKGEEVVSVCYAAAISERLAEVDVVTDEAFRGQSLANIVARQFIRECLAREITPTWDCFAYNTGSLRLAEKLGFSEERRYPFYSFNVPLPQKGTTG